MPWWPPKQIWRSDHKHYRPIPPNLKAAFVVVNLTEYASAVFDEQDGYDELDGVMIYQSRVSPVLLVIVALNLTYVSLGFSETTIVA